MTACCLLAAAFAGVALWREPGELGWIAPMALPLALLGMTLVAASVLLRRAVEVRRLTSRLEDERALSSSSSNRLRDLSALVSTARTMNAGRDPDETLRLLLEEGLGFFRAVSGSIMLADGAGFLRTVCARGNEHAVDARVKLGHGVAGHVALAREPLLLEGTPGPDQFPDLVERAEPVGSAMSVPLIHRDEVLGVLNLNGQERPFTDHDLQLAAVFAGHVSVAIANAGVLASERDRVDQLAEVNRSTTELLRAIGQDLRRPVAALAEDVRALERMVPGDEATQEVVQGMERHVDRLARSMDQLLRAPEEPAPAPPASESSADLREVTGTVASDFGAQGKPVNVEASDQLPVRGDASLLQQVLWNLLDNAFTHGAPPVWIRLRSSDGHGVVSVIDSGPGLTADHLDRMGPGIAGETVGVGLSIVQAIVSGSGGRVWAENAPGGGAIFHVAVPLAEPAGAHVREGTGGSTLPSDA